MKIDAFCHIFPKTYYDRMLSISGKGTYVQFAALALKRKRK